ncbi:hypothetical protein F9278_20590 [Streptomyces phaeolivaceus]|uniref:Secreted protein n=1 Tax=Streptomyces phaeolivaceus TaxID=2653200 RepID=A0A5P8K593_9ACTN|nr:hypothetical protein [Streptomyces phaeolivaceus]QFQ98204.1 hypothetical protein F9278_20590 [Streptomyces phaeolivaceus]
MTVRTAKRQQSSKRLPRVVAASAVTVAALIGFAAPAQAATTTIIMPTFGDAISACTNSGGTVVNSGFTERAGYTSLWAWVQCEVK